MLTPSLQVQPTATAHQSHSHVSFLGRNASTSYLLEQATPFAHDNIQLQDNSQVQRIYRTSVATSIINDPMCLSPILCAYPHRPLSPLVSSKPDFSPSLPHSVTASNPIHHGLLHKFLSSWAHNPNNPSLSGPPPPFHLEPISSITPTPTTSSTTRTPCTQTPSSLIPAFSPQFTPGQSGLFSPKLFNPYTNTIPTSHNPKKIYTPHTSHFKPYSLDRNLYVSTAPASLSPEPPHFTSDSTNSTSHVILSPGRSSSTGSLSQLSTPSPPEKPPYIHSTVSSTESSPSRTTRSKGKGKAACLTDEDDIPLAQLKKQRYDDTISLEMVAAYSLTQLQHAASSPSPMQDFLDNPLSGLLPPPPL